MCVSLGSCVKFRKVESGIEKALGTGVNGGARERAKHNRARRVSWCRTSEPSGDLNSTNLGVGPRNLHFKSPRVFK